MHIAQQFGNTSCFLLTFQRNCSTFIIQVPTSELLITEICRDSWPRIPGDRQFDSSTFYMWISLPPSGPHFEPHYLPVNRIMAFIWGWCVFKCNYSSEHSIMNSTLDMGIYIIFSSLYFGQEIKMKGIFKLEMSNRIPVFPPPLVPVLIIFNAWML